MKRSLLTLAGLLATFFPSAAQAQDVTSGLKLHLPLEETAPFSDTLEKVSGTMCATSAYTADTRLNPGFRLNGSQGVVYHGAIPITNRLTISVWVKPEDFSGNFGYHNIAAKSFLSARPIAWQLYLSNGKPALRCNAVNAGGTPVDPTLASDTVLTIGSWQHVAVTSDGANVRFYLNGSVIKTIAQNVTFGTSSGFFTLGDVENFGTGIRGAVWDLRVYDRALAAADIGSLASSPPPVRLPVSYKGLWTAQVSLNEVKEVSSGNWGPAPSPFMERMLLHVDALGNLKLLQEATLMQTRVTPPAQPEQIVVTQPALIPNFDGITRRGGKVVGQRFSSATVVLPSDAVPFSNAGDSFRADMTLPASHPLNPFRHKYHPDLATGRALQRTIYLSLPPADSPSDNTITGTAREVMGGLHKSTLEARGPVTFSRVSTSGKLNQP